MAKLQNVRIKFKKKTQIITIDPGIAGTGYAIWAILNNTEWKLLKYGVIQISSGHWKMKRKTIARKLTKLGRIWKASDVFIENPRTFGSVKGKMVAQRGDLVKLAELVGYLEASFNLYDIRTHLVEIINWKGQLPKEVVIKRIKRIYPNLKAKSHDWDAVGIGLYLKGDF